MSDGHYCVVRDLGLVKGGKGMKHHEVVIDFSRQGIVKLFARLFLGSRQPEPSAPPRHRVVRKAPLD